MKIPAPSWYDLAHQITRCTFFSIFEDWDRVLETVEPAEAETARRQYRSLRAALLCARARAFAATGRHAAADAALGQAIRTCPRGAAEPLIIWEAAKAVCACHRGGAATAGRHFDRALAACHAVGHRLQARLITADRSRYARRGVAVPAPAASDPRAESDLLLGDVATILRSGHSADLLANRLGMLLDATTLRGRFERQEDTGTERPDEAAVTWDAGADGTATLRLAGGDRLVRFTFRDVHSLDDIALLKSLVELAQAAVARRADSDTDEDGPNLWPESLLPDNDDVVFWSPRMIELRRVAIRLAATDLPILITGETGTGKELVARLIHQHSAMRHGPFVPFNCSAVPRDLADTQLFGHRRGAFTGAVDSFPGVVRAADRGTLFLDEIGDLDPAVQPKFLRFLENAEVHPVGEARPQSVKVRIVAATNADLEDLVADGRFRRDLYYRVGVARLTLPALRERKDEIPALAALFVSRFAKELGRANLRAGDDFIAALLMHDWPGNIRQLAGEIRRIVALAEDGHRLSAADLSPDVTRNLRAVQVQVASDSPTTVAVRLDQPLDGALEELERLFIERALAATDGRVTEAARLLGVSRKGLFLKRRRWGLVESTSVESTGP